MRTAKQALDLVVGRDKAFRSRHLTAGNEKTPETCKKLPRATPRKFLRVPSAQNPEYSVPDNKAISRCQVARSFLLNLFKSL